MATDFDLNGIGAAVRKDAKIVAENVFPEAVDIVKKSPEGILYSYKYDLGPSYHRYLDIIDNR